MDRYIDVTEKVHSNNAYSDYGKYDTIYQDVITGELITDGRKFRTIPQLTKEEEDYVNTKEYYQESRGWFCNVG